MRLWRLRGEKLKGLSEESMHAVVYRGEPAFTAGFAPTFRCKDGRQHWGVFNWQGRTAGHGPALFSGVRPYVDFVAHLCDNEILTDYRRLSAQLISLRRQRMKSQVIRAAQLEWQRVRPDVAHGVYGRTLLADGLKVTLTRVEPGGAFGMHRDDYGHLFYFIGGTGRVEVEDQQVKAEPGLAVQVAAGAAHAYANTGTEDLVLISINIPGSRHGQ